MISLLICNLFKMLARSSYNFIKAMNVQLAKLTIYPLSFNKTNYDHLIYEPQDTHKVFKTIKLKT